MLTYGVVCRKEAIHEASVFPVIDDQNDPCHSTRSCGAYGYLQSAGGEEDRMVPSEEVRSAEFCDADRAVLPAVVQADYAVNVPRARLIVRADHQCRASLGRKTEE